MKGTNLRANIKLKEGPGLSPLSPGIVEVQTKDFPVILLFGEVGLRTTAL